VVDVLLTGCAPEPLAAYLKALAILRLVAEQADPDARGAWRPEGFLLTSKLDQDGLLEFFLDRYAPTPIIAPWNGGSGFHPKDNSKALDVLAGATSPRFAGYREAIRRARDVLAQLGLRDKPDKTTKETAVLPRLRSELDDATLEWLDAAIVLTGDGPKYPPLLGTGGNDGRLDFTNNQMQRLVQVLLCEDDRERARSQLWLASAVMGSPATDLQSGAIGQFHPAAAGGANAGPGFSREALANPWDYIFMLEGALLFAAAATKRLEGTANAGMAYPFMVASTGSGYASASATDTQGTRNELWLPIWTSPSTIRELRLLLSEGRAKVGERSARTGVDFAVALSSLGVDRGIASFIRYGFHARNGLAYFATPLGRMTVKRRKGVDLLAPLDQWLQQFRWKGMGEKSPASIRRAGRNLEESIVDLCSGRTQGPLDVLMALGALDQALSVSRKHEVAPIPPLSKAWLARCDDGSQEFELACSLASTGIRERMVRVRWNKHWAWQEPDDGRTVWGGGSLVDNLIAALRREDVESVRSPTPTVGSHRIEPSFSALQAFLQGDTDDDKLARILQGLAIVDFRTDAPSRRHQATDRPRMSACFPLLALAHSRLPFPDIKLPRTPALVARIAAGDAGAATALAVRRLRGAGLMPRVDRVVEPRWRARRVAAALMFPLGEAALARLAQRALQPRTSAPLSPTE